MNRGNIPIIRIAAAVLAAAFFTRAGAAADAAPLTVVELFQSQGCSDCPPANANVMILSDRPDLLTLSFGVTYWDQLGWKDTFASPQYTDRQWDYAHAFHRDKVFTPEVVVNGRGDVVGRDMSELEALIRREANMAANMAGPDIRIANDSVALGPVVSREDSIWAPVWLVRFDPSVEQVPVARGENGGLTLPHKNVVKQLVRLGYWTGVPASFSIPKAAGNGLRTAVIVQAKRGGAILAAARD